jgi:hypothetical protein
LLEYQRDFMQMHDLESKRVNLGLRCGDEDATRVNEFKNFKSA